VNVGFIYTLSLACCRGSPVTEVCLCVSVQMGCLTINGVMYSLRPYVRGALSRTPYPPSVETVDFGDDTYRLIPVELRLNFDDERRRSRTGNNRHSANMKHFGLFPSNLWTLFMKSAATVFLS